MGKKKRKRKLLWVCNLSFSILLIEHVEQDNGGVSSVTQIQPSVLLIGMIVVYGKKKKRKRKLLWVCNLSFSILLIEHVEQDNEGVSSVTQIQPSVLLWEKCHTHHFATIFSPVRNWLQTFVYAS